MCRGAAKATVMKYAALYLKRLRSLRRSCVRDWDSTLSSTRTKRRHSATGPKHPGCGVLVPVRNGLEPGTFHLYALSSDPGKWMEDETVAAGFVVALKRGNAGGAKEPYCT